MNSNKREGEINPPRVNAPRTDSVPSRNMNAVGTSLAAIIESDNDEADAAVAQSSAGLPGQQPVPQRVSRLVFRSRIPRPIPGFNFSSRVLEIAAVSARESAAPNRNIGNRRVTTGRVAPVSAREAAAPIRNIENRRVTTGRIAVLSAREAAAPIRNIENRRVTTGRIAALSAREAAAPIRNIGNRRVTTERIPHERTMIGRSRSVEEPNVSCSNSRQTWASSLAFSSRYYPPSPMRNIVPNIRNEQTIRRLGQLRNIVPNARNEQAIRRLAQLQNHEAVSTSPPNWSRKQTVDLGKSTEMTARQSEEVREKIDQTEEEIDDINKGFLEICTDLKRLSCIVVELERSAMGMTTGEKETSKSSEEDEDFHSIISSDEAFEDAEAGDLP